MRGRRWPALGLATLLVLGLIVGCGGKPAKTPAHGPQAANASNTQAPRADYTPGGTYDAEDYVGPAQTVANWEFEPDVKSTSAATRKCVRYKRVNGKSRCADYKTEPGKVTVSDDADWYLVLADGTRIDVDQQTQARYPVGAMYP